MLTYYHLFIHPTVDRYLIISRYLIICGITLFNAINVLSWYICGFLLGAYIEMEC